LVPVPEREPPIATVIRPPKPPKVVVPKVTGKLACSTVPAGARVFVNGKDTRRDTPVALNNPLVLPVGSHTVLFKLDGRQSKPVTVTIKEDDVAKLIGIPLE
jgi:eukaryotic-like serine/threonine-protein kinase